MERGCSERILTASLGYKGMQISKFTPMFSNATLYFILITIIISGLFVRVPPTSSIANIDELIPVELISSMKQRGDLDPDWNKSINRLPYNFPSMRYNFSAYIIVSSLLTPKDADHKYILANVRSLNLLFFSLTAVALFFLPKPAG